MKRHVCAFAIDCSKACSSTFPISDYCQTTFLHITTFIVFGASGNTEPLSVVRLFSTVPERVASDKLCAVLQ